MPVTRARRQERRPFSWQFFIAKTHRRVVFLHTRVTKTINRYIVRSPWARRMRRKFRTLPKNFRVATATIVIVTLIIPAVFLRSTPAFAATYTWDQTDWQGGTDSGTLANHTSNRTGWTQYSSISAMSGTTSAGNAVLTTASFTATDDGTLTTTGSATGGGFSSGTTSSTTASGSGSAGTVTLTPTTTAFNAFDIGLQPTPGTLGGGGRMIRNGSDDDVYITRGGGTTSFYKYTISTSTWTTLTAIPAAISWGSSMIRNSSDDAIYISQGNAGTGFYKYSISGNSWTTLTVVPGALGGDSRMIRNGADDEIYVSAGSNTTFYKYSISGNSWTTLTASPATMSWGSRMLRNATEDYIYLTPGNATTALYRYSISGNSWTAMTAAPAAIGDGSNMIRNGSDDEIYVSQGNNGTGFYSYSISGNSWTTLTVVPGAAQYGSTLIRNSSDNDIYFTRGNASTGFYKYSISGNSWTTLAVTPGNISTGSILMRNSTDNEIYLTQGANTGFYKYSISGDSWTGSTTSNVTAAPATLTTGSSMIRNGSDDLVYVTRGGGTGFYSYSISGNSWSTLAVVPGTVGAGSSMIRNASDDEIYVTQGGGNTGFYKYSIAGNSWTTLTVVPGAPGDGSRMIRNSTDDDIYILRGGGNTGFYKYSIAGNSYTSLTVVPSAVAAGGSMIRNGSDNDIYILAGNGTAFYQYSISGNSYTTLTVVPGALGAGANMIRNSSDNDIYIVRGASSTSFYKYSISGNSYTTLTVIPATIGAGGAIIRNSTDDDIYIAQGGGTGFYRYSIAGNSYTTLSILPGTLAAGAVMIRNSSDNDFYILQSNATTNLWRYYIDKTTYPSSGTFTSAVIDTTGVTAYGNLSWTKTLPAVTTLTLATRSGGTASPDGTWTDWSSELSTSTGSAITSGAARYIQYRATFGTSNTSFSPTLSDVTTAYTAYNTSGNLVSSIFNSEDANNIIGGLVWTEDSSLPSGTTVTVSLRAAATSGGVAGASYSNFTNATSNCSKSTGTVTCTSSAIPAGLLTNAQYFQYKIALASTNGAATPTVGSVTTTYVVNASPQIQSVTATQNADGTVTIGYETRDPDTTTGTTTPGYITPSFEYWDGDSYNTITTVAAGDTSNKAVNADGTTWNSYSATWTATTDFAAQYMNNTAKIRVTVNDNEAANNTASAESATFTLDTKVPASASVVADFSSATSSNSYAATLTLAATDDSSITMMISTTSNHASPLFSGAYATSKEVIIPNTPDAPSTMYVRFTDAKGNITNVSATPPARATNLMIQDISNIDVTPAEYRLFTAWKALSPTGFGSYKIYRSTDQSSWSLLSTIVTASTNYYTDTTPSADTTYYYRVIITDSDGDIAFVSATVTGVANGTQDPSEGAGGTVIAPTISSVTITSITPTTATVKWDTDQVSNSTVGYSTTAGLFNSTTTVASMVDTAAGVGQHTVVLSGLSANTTYYVRASSTNTTGSTGTATNGGNGYSFTTLSGPAITSTGTARTETITNTTATIVWQTSTEADSAVIYSSSPSFTSSSTASSATLVTDHSVTVTSLSAATKYFFYVQSTDGSGNVETDKNVVDGIARYYSFTTTNDSTAPTISATSATAQPTVAVILWTTDEPATSQVEYGSTISYGTSSTLDSTLTTQHSVSLTGLTSGSTYHYRIKTMDADSNLTTGSDQTFTTGDSTAPVISSVTSGSLALTGATITWTTDEQASSIVEYGTTVSYGSTAGNEADAVTSHSVTLSGLSANTLYYYRVRSRDASGNLATEDNSSAGYTFTTVADTTAPTISAVAAPLVSDTSAVITWTTNEVANARVYYGTSISYGSSTSVTAVNTTTQTVTLTGLTKSTAYYFYVVSADPSGNSTTDNNSSAGYTFTTTAQPTSGSGGTGSGGTIYAITVHPPMISGVVVSNITKTSVRVTWDTDKDSNSIVSYNAPGGPTLIDGDSDVSTSKHIVDITGLESATTYSYRATSYEPKGAKTVGESGKFTTLSLDGKLIAPPEVVKPIKPTTPVTTPITTTAKDTPLLDAIKGIIENPLLQSLPESVIVSFLNEIAEKAIAPPQIIANAAKVEVKGTVAVIEWTTDKKTMGLVSYGKESEPLTEKNQFSIAASGINTFKTEHRVVLDNLDPGTTYRYEVQTKAPYGPEAQSVSGIFKTTTELPVITAIRLNNIKDDSVTLDWKTNIPTSVSVEFTDRSTGTTLSQGDTSLLRDHSITLKDLASGAPYSLVIKAYDEVKNESSSGAIPFTTGKDILAPEISKVTAESTIYPGKESRVQTIVTWTTNEPATSQVFYQEGFGANTKAIELSKDETLSLAHTMVVTKFAPASIYKFWVVSVDVSGNSTRSKDYTILTPQQKETVVDVIIKNFEQTFGWTSKLRSP